MDASIPGGKGEAGEEKGIATPPHGEEGAAGVAAGGKSSASNMVVSGHSRLFSTTMQGMKAR